eukprot:834000-Pyramimonas_sp.AAC.2
MPSFSHTKWCSFEGASSMRVDPPLKWRYSWQLLRTSESPTQTSVVTFRPPSTSVTSSGDVRLASCPPNLVLHRCCAAGQSAARARW